MSEKNISRYCPFKAGGGGGAGGTERWSADIWGLGCLIWEVYNGPLPAMDQLSRLADIPRALQPVYKV
jgi:SCY1-like protein 1